MGGRHQPRVKKTKTSVRDLRYANADGNEHYGRCKSLTGSGRMRLVLGDGTEVDAKVCGTMYKRVWINAGDLVLCSGRGLGQCEKYDVIHKYPPEEERLLRRYGELGAALTSSKDAADAAEDEFVVFAEDDDADIAAI